jgi:hypothetical protein
MADVGAWDVLVTAGAALVGAVVGAVATSRATTRTIRAAVAAAQEQREEERRHVRTSLLSAAWLEMQANVGLAEIPRDDMIMVSPLHRVALDAALPELATLELPVRASIDEASRQITRFNSAVGRMQALSLHGRALGAIDDAQVAIRPVLSAAEAALKHAVTNP